MIPATVSGVQFEKATDYEEEIVAGYVELVRCQFSRAMRSATLLVFGIENRVAVGGSNFPIAAARIALNDDLKTRPA